MFSPYYARARRRGPADPLDFCAMNVVLYGGRKRWALTERGRGALARSPTTLTIGPSAMRFEGGALVVEFAEMTVPWPGRIAGRVRLYLSGITPGPFRLDGGGRHRWWPIAPVSRAEVTLTSPNVSFSGDAYFDMNEGTAPLEQDFTSWNWSRAPRGREAAIIYDVVRSDGSFAPLALRVDSNGAVEQVEGPPCAGLAPGPIWRMPRETRCDAGEAPRVRRTLEDTPFYTRSMIETQLFGTRGPAMHESLNMPRFTAAATQMLLPFRMPRRFW